MNVSYVCSEEINSLCNYFNKILKYFFLFSGSFRLLQILRQDKLGSINKVSMVKNQETKFKIRARDNILCACMNICQKTFAFEILELIWDKMLRGKATLL